ncbi:zona pellucida sperm-binding protein 2-like [Mercenaria mercenaria]|uniref:zona pellucida sperm-binding protein 2-like n=1 Tax=Mercenaria mercenaria TaxID=6596 RepID=UPI00234E62F8|nr:zona pellucida sperm-binding protein 2-like [Mercenaria mercenaria]
MQYSNIEDCAKCGCDWLDVKDGQGAQTTYVTGIGDRICGVWQRPDSVFTTAGNTLTLTFMSDNGDQMSGFELLIKTKPNELKDSILVGCNQDNWDIKINMTLLHDLYPTVKTTDIYLGENRCTGSETTGVLRFQQGLSECLTNQKDMNDLQVYANELIAVERNPQFAFIIKRYIWKLEVECDLTANGSVSAGGFKDEVVTGHTSYGQEQKLNISFYLDPSFNNKVHGNPLNASAGAHIYLKVFTSIKDWTITMKLKTCYVIPSLHAPENMKYYLIKNGCEADTNTHILSQTGHETQLVFDYFEYTENKNGIYVICEGLICSPTDTSVECKISCIPNT